MADKDVFAMILTPGGKVVKLYKDAETARVDLKQMVASGAAINAYVFKKFLFHVKNQPQVVVTKEFE